MRTNATNGYYPGKTESVLATWCHWLRMREECNPRWVTLKVWAQYNFPTLTDDDLDWIWENYLDYMKKIESNYCNATGHGVYV